MITSIIIHNSDFEYLKSQIKNPDVLEILDQLKPNNDNEIEFDKITINNLYKTADTIITQFIYDMNNYSLGISTCSSCNKKGKYIYECIICDSIFCDDCCLNYFNIPEEKCHKH